MSIPDEDKIYNYIFDELKGKYEKRTIEVGSNKYLAKEDIEWYLGTYWPRSFVELYKISEDLFTNPEIKKIFETKKEFNILDIGSGTGGNVFGFLWFMKEYFKEEFKNKKINVHAIDVSG